MNENIWDRLDYQKNAVIEASAGTGKTYTLEHIVKKLVLEKGYDIRSILLVTFTEKAAGELKERIRKMLQGTQKKMRNAWPVKPAVSWGKWLGRRTLRSGKTILRKRRRKSAMENWSRRFEPCLAGMKVAPGRMRWRTQMEV